MNIYTQDDVKKIKTALANNAKLARQSIAHQDNETLNTLVVKQLLLTGLWADIQLYELIHKANVFDGAEIAEISAPHNNNRRQWNAALYFAYIHCLEKITSIQNHRRCLYWWQYLDEAINKPMHLTLLLNLNCKTKFLETGEVSEQEVNRVWSGQYENLQSLIFKRNMIDSLTMAIREFATLPIEKLHYTPSQRSLMDHSIRLRTMSYEKYEERIRSSFIKGLAKRNAN